MSWFFSKEKFIENIGFILSQTWYPVANTLIKKQTQTERALYYTHDRSSAHDRL
jgi:hypothetical protein